MLKISATFLPENYNPELDSGLSNDKMEENEQSADLNISKKTIFVF